jgi:hypothetical protein
MALTGVICIEEPYGEKTLGKTKMDTGEMSFGLN